MTAQETASSLAQREGKEIVSGGAAFPTTSVSPGTQSPEAMEQEGVENLNAGHGQRTQAQLPEPATHLHAAQGPAAGSTGQSASVVSAAQPATPSGKRQKLQHGPSSASSAGTGSEAEVAAEPAAPANPAEQGFVTPAKQQQLRRWPSISHDSPTAVVARDDDGTLAVMPPASVQPGATQVRVELNPLVLISWIGRYGAEAACMTNLPAGLLDRIGVPALSARDKEQHDIDSFLRTLGVHHACMGTSNIQLADIWLRRVPMAAQVASLSIAIPKGGFNQRTLCKSHFTKV